MIQKVHTNIIKVIQRSNQWTVMCPKAYVPDSPNYISNYISFFPSLTQAMNDALRWYKRNLRNYPCTIEVKIDSMQTVARMKSPTDAEVMAVILQYSGAT